MIHAEKMFIAESIDQAQKMYGDVLAALTDSEVSLPALVHWS